MTMKTDKCKNLKFPDEDWAGGPIGKSLRDEMPSLVLRDEDACFIEEERKVLSGYGRGRRCLLREHLFSLLSEDWRLIPDNESRKLEWVCLKAVFEWRYGTDLPPARRNAAYPSSPSVTISFSREGWVAEFRRDTVSRKDALPDCRTEPMPSAEKAWRELCRLSSGQRP